MTTENMTAEEAHRQRVREQLDAVQKEFEIWLSYSELERALARAAWLEALISEVHDTARAGNLAEVEMMTEMPPDVDLDADIRWMRAARMKAGTALPAVDTFRAAGPN